MLSRAGGLTALNAKGKQRWVIKECCGEGPPALAPNGMILGTGFRHGPPATQSDTEAISITSSGAVSWRIQPLGVLKRSIPLVSETNVLYLPIKGPEGVDAQGLNIMSTDGKLLQRLPPIDDMALGVDGTVFSTTASGLQAHAADGSLLWSEPLQSAALERTGPLVGRDDTVYVGEGKILDAFSSSGTLLWRYKKTDGALTLAERENGVILVAGRRRLDAVNPDGTRLWQASIGASTAQYAAERPSLIMDGDGTAYVGSEDGLVRAISVDGAWQASFDAGGSHDHFTPGIILDAERRLIVSGTDGAMRVYGS